MDVLCSETFETMLKLPAFGTDFQCLRDGSPAMHFTP
jgi:hypothetical protein